MLSLPPALTQEHSVPTGIYYGKWEQDSHAPSPFPGILPRTRQIPYILAGLRVAACGTELCGCGEGNSPFLSR